MAGHRRKSGNGLMAEERVSNRKQYHQERLANAITPLERVYVAMEGVRAALKRLPPDRAGELADLVVERAAQVMEDAWSDLITDRRSPDDRRR